MIKSTYKLIFCEFQCIGFEHTPVNHAMVISFALTYPNESFLVVGEIEHIKIIEENIIKQNIHNVNFSYIKLPKRESSVMQRLIPDFMLIKHLLTVMTEYNTNKAIFLSINTSLLLWLKVLIFSFSFNMMVIPHSILESLLTRMSKKPWYWIVNFKNVFLYFNFSRVKYILLSPSISNELEKINSKILKYCHVMHHPYIFNQKNICFTELQKIIFGYLGVGHKNKGFDTFVLLGNDIKLKKFTNTSKFVCIGKVIDKTIDLSTSNVEVLFDDFISRDIFDRECKKITYAVFPYRQDAYRLYPSGAFFDALMHAKPILCIKNSFFEYYFTLLGDIGYLCDDYNEMKSVAESILVNFPQERYELQVENIKNSRHIFEPKEQKNNVINLLKVWED